MIKASDITPDKIKNRIIDYFMVIKFVTSLFGVILVNLFRQFGIYSVTSHLIIIIFMALNILEAVVLDILIGFYANGLVGIGLILLLPFTIEEYIIYQIQTEESGLYLLHLDWYWIILYTSWNCCFSYGANLSWMTRLILLPPIIISLIINVDVWLSARVLLLLFSMMMRVIQIIWFYNPGQSYLTPIAGSICNNSYYTHWWSIINLIWLLCIVLFK
jgi:hypothetical protein